MFSDKVLDSALCMLYNILKSRTWRFGKWIRLPMGMWLSTWILYFK